MADWEYPTLGFDPLPGDPEVARWLQDDARVFGHRMIDESRRLRALKGREWSGRAADAFSEHIDKLPRDLERCGEAFADLSAALGNFHDTFLLKKAEARRLEERAAAAKARVDAQQTLSTLPVISAPDCPPPRDRSALDTAEDEYGQIIREAHRFAEDFDDSPEIRHLAEAIRSFTEFAPDEPRFNFIKQWAGDVFKLTPLGMSLELARGIHEFVNHFAEFFSDLADFISDISGTLGLLSLPLMFVPGVGQAVAIAALTTAVASTAVKSSLYVGKARDADGKLYVAGGELLASVGDSALNVAGMGAAAKAAQAAKAAENVGMSFTRAYASQFSKKAFTDAKLPMELARELGAKGAAKKLFQLSVAEWGAKGTKELSYVVGGAAINLYGPRVTLMDSSNWGGWRALTFIGPDFLDVFRDAANEPDLHLEPLADASGSGSAAPARKPPQPVMKH